MGIISLTGMTIYTSFSVMILELFWGSFDLGSSSENAENNLKRVGGNGEGGI